MLILVTENRLDEWARKDSQNARRVIPELVWRLVSASCPYESDRRFPLGDSIGQHGPDGQLCGAEGYRTFVPQGDSLWEFGTGVNAKEKATDDFNNLVKNWPKDIREYNTFVFVTPLSGQRDWQYTRKDGEQILWIEEQRRKKEWKDVRVIDGTKLVDWLHHSPATELWLAEKIFGTNVEHVETLEHRWEGISSIQDPYPLPPSIFLINREQACAMLNKVFDGSLKQLKLITHYPDEATSFIAAYIASIDIESRIETGSRCIIVSEKDEWISLCNYSENLILIADAKLDISGDTGSKLIQKASRAGHSIVFAGSYSGYSNSACVSLTKPRKHQVQEALVKAGYNEERARILAHKSAGNICVLLRCLQDKPIQPDWAIESDASELAIAELLGSWSENSVADRNVAENLSGKSYGEWIIKIRDISYRPATPIVHSEGNWKFVLRYEGWYALGSRLYDEHLERFKAAVVSVLSESDPQFELPPEERYLAGVHGKVLTYSKLLRKGMAESLALLGSHPQALTSCSRSKALATAVLAVRKILENADWTRWASLNDLLPLLAEAAPDEFLDAVENALKIEPCPFDQIFEQERVGITGRNYMTGLLWALETIAWDKDYMVRVILCLGELAERDPGGRWANRPSNSMTNILLPWLRQTCAPIDKQVVAVKNLITEKPRAGWRLLVSLLPNHTSSVLSTHRPVWRSTITDDWPKDTTNREYFELISQYIELAFSEAQKDVLKLSELIDYLDSMPLSAFDRLLEHLSSDTVVDLPEKERLEVWNKLNRLMLRHKKHADKDWTIKPELVDRIEATAKRLAPDKPFFRHQMLFSEQDLIFFEDNGNYREQEKRLQARRQNAIEEIVADSGPKSVIEFSKAVDSPWRVGFSLGVIDKDEAEEHILPCLLDSENESLVQFARGFIQGRWYSRKWQWVDGLEIDNWLPEQMGSLFSFLPFSPETWERVASLLGEDQSAYWNHANANPFEAEDGLEFAVDQLINHQRPYSALWCITGMLHDKKSFESSIAVRALLEACKTSEKAGSNQAYDIVQIIKYLQNDPTTEQADLIKVEWAYLPFLDKDNDASPKFLWRKLVNEPKFFCDIIRRIFRPNKEEDTTEETEEMRSFANHAYELLNGWRMPPGVCEGSAFDSDHFIEWLNTVKDECARTGHLDIALTIIGHVLIHAPADPDGLWVHSTVAEALNAKDASDMRDAFGSALINSRGFHVVDPEGKPERELAEKYRSQAEEVEHAGYPRLATTLRELATTYDREAEKIIARERIKE